MTEPAPIQDAATILLVRGETPFEIFLVRRHAKMKFMPDAMVFPGGRVDESDARGGMAPYCDLTRAQAAAALGIDDGARALAFFVAACRETFEEVGVLLARHRDGRPLKLDTTDAAHFAAYREQLNNGATKLQYILETEDLVLDLSALTFNAHWITPPIEQRRYDTRFFIARAPADQSPLHDDGETVDSAWMTPADTLAAYAAGSLTLAPPTLRILSELARLPNATAALDHRRADRPIPYQPQPFDAGGELHLLLPGDPDFDPPGAARNRILLRDGKWRSEGQGY